MTFSQVLQQPAFAYLPKDVRAAADKWCNLIPAGYTIFGASFDHHLSPESVLDLFERKVTKLLPSERLYDKAIDFAPHRIPLIKAPVSSYELERFRGDEVRIGHTDLRLVNPASFSAKMIQFTIPPEMRGFEKFEQFEVIVRLHPVASARPRTSTGALETMPARHGQLWVEWEKIVVKRMVARGRSDEEIADAIERVPNAVFCYRQKNGIRSSVSSNEGVL